MDPVKSRRRYDASHRRAQAARAREAVLAAARSSFVDVGYSTTTVAAIARQAGVSVETIYKSFGGKAALARALYERALAGQGQVAAYERSDAVRLEQTDPRALMRAWGTLTAEVAEQLTPVLLIVRAAAGHDASMATLLRDSDTERLERMRHNARFLAERGYLRDGVTTEHAADVMWTCSSAEIYELLVLRRGWSSEQFATFVAETMAAALLP
ncbi:MULTISPECIES: TetR/AcrR family transcriptional regulator [Georgenia]|uniref:TetR family transcriptional regulator n=1 Tax=Georgenia muralis TaxID=154117 RepID=A0A3N5A0M6_9MICO|nr:TetR/AcrR family transcriptional regulator [Georgenia muralis]RPF26905.1 TetR family transcriptional regulator [Georgenia muralis]